jgi:hypothetical protein
VNAVMKFRLHKMQGISWLAELLLDFRGLCFMQLDITNRDWTNLVLDLRIMSKYIRVSSTEVDRLNFSARNRSEYYGITASTCCMQIKGR